MLRRVEYNVFNFPASMVTVDLLTDSGTAALYQPMWAAMMLGDESYARNAWYYCFLDAVRDFCQRGDRPKKRYVQLFDSRAESFKTVEQDFSHDATERGLVSGGVEQFESPNAFLLPQGRCCETVLFQSLRPYWQGAKPLILSNGLFETTRANAEFAGFACQDLFDPRLMSSSFSPDKVGQENPFWGNMNLPALENFLKTSAGNVAAVIMTLTNNTGAGQPVSLANMREVRGLCRRYGRIPLWIDAARIADNAAFIKRFERGCGPKSVPEILKELFGLCDGFHFSLKKALCNIGGLMCLRQGGAFTGRYPKIGTLMRKLQILSYGHDSYGALSGRDIAAATVALGEISKEDHLYPRIEQTQYLALQLAKRKVPVVLPPGGHAVYIDVNTMFEGRPWNDLMGVGLVVELLRRYGVRGCEMGYMAMELDLYYAKHKKLPEPMPPNLVRLAIPANVYGREHMDYVADALGEIMADRESVPGMEMVRGQEESGLRYFAGGLRMKSRR